MAARRTGSRTTPPRGGVPGVLTLAGEGTRMLPWSRGLRKEFLPLYDRGLDGSPVLKPIAHLVLEAFMAAGVGDATLVVQPRDLALVQEYFTVDPGFLARHRHHPERLAETREFYAKLRALRLRYAVQPHPAGFGDAVLRAAPYVGSRPFLVQASDGIVLEPPLGAVHRAMIDLLQREGLDGVLLVRKVRDARRYGVVEGRLAGTFGGRPRIDVVRMEEKPDRPKSHWAATALYTFSPRLFDALREVRAEQGPRTELELTDGVQRLLTDGRRVAALVLRSTNGWRSVGSPEGYFRALRETQLRTFRGR